MANQPVRVMLRAYGGVPLRYASEDEQKQSLEKLGEVLRKWKAAGVKLIGAFNTFGTWSDSDGHFMILDFESLEQVNEFYEEFSNSGTLFDKLSLTVGPPSPAMGSIWESL